MRGGSGGGGGGDVSRFRFEFVLYGEQLGRDSVADRESENENEATWSRFNETKWAAAVAAAAATSPGFASSSYFTENS